MKTLAAILTILAGLALVSSLIAFAASMNQYDPEQRNCKTMFCDQTEDRTP